MTRNSKSSQKQNQEDKKSATNNQWTNSSLDQESLPRGRQDGPGGN